MQNKTKKDNILEKALEIMTKEGLSGLTIRKLARSLGMSAANIYNYFKNKDEIYLTLIIKGFSMLYDQLKMAAQAETNPEDKALAMARAYLHFGLSKRGYYEIMFTYPFPKYYDYLGTSFEDLSATEYQISMDIVSLAADIIQELFEYKLPPLQTTKLLIQAWSQLHGLLSLHHSQIIHYVTDDIHSLFDQILSDILDHLRNQRLEPSKF